MPEPSRGSETHYPREALDAMCRVTGMPTEAGRHVMSTMLAAALPHLLTDEAVERAAIASYMIEKEVTEAEWETAHRFVKAEYRKVARRAVEAVLGVGDNHE